MQAKINLETERTVRLSVNVYDVVDPKVNDKVFHCGPLGVF